MDENKFEGAARQAGGKIEGAVGAVTGDEKTKATGYIDDTVGSAQRAYGQAKDNVRGMAGQVGDQAADYGSQLLDQIEDAGDYIAEQVDQRPVTAVLIAAAVGFLIALVTKPAPKVVYRRR